jgi:PKD repeat protein
MRQFIILSVIMLLSLFVVNCGKDKSSGPSVPDPVASFAESGATVTPATLAFTNTSQNADSYVWRFGDGDTTTITDPTHVYNSHGDYIVILIAKNSTTGKTSTKSQLISITPGSVYIQAIIINSIPFVDSYGAGWDLDSGPDLYPDLDTNAGLILSFSTSYYLDAQPSSLPIRWNLSSQYLIHNWTIAYFVSAWDYDDFSNDDYIGSTNGFIINNVIQTLGYVSSLSIQNSSGIIQATVILRWQ